MNYYISTRFSINRYKAVKLISIAMVSEDSRELVLDNISYAQMRKAIIKFTNTDKSEAKFYSYYSAFHKVAYWNIWGYNNINNFPYFRDLKYLEDYISEKVGFDFGVNEDSNYPFADVDFTVLEDAQWMKKLHEFLIEFDKRINLNYNSDKDVPTGPNFRSMYGNYTTKTENY